MGKPHFGRWVVFGLMIIAPSVHGGRKIHRETSVDMPGRSAFGQIGATRNSDDEVQYIGCAMFARTTDTLGHAFCAALDNTGAFGSCVTTLPRMIAVIQGMPNDADVQFTWDTRGQCTLLFINNASYQEPKNP